jgi:hypothetical protein
MKMITTKLSSALSFVVTATLAALLVLTGFSRAAAGDGGEAPRFTTSDNCVACHNGVLANDGRDVSIGTTWSGSMMSNAARDPYWHAAVRREVMEHPDAAETIERECSRCHMPMAHHIQLSNGTSPGVLEHLPLSAANNETSVLAADGVSCVVCHQITDEKFGAPESFSGGFIIDVRGGSSRHAYGPFAPDAGLKRVMESATSYSQTESRHIQRSELCATCHTLHTHAVVPGAEGHAPFPEQVPYLEWRHSSYVDSKSCQDCHMPELDRPTAVASVLGEPREAVSEHVFRGGNILLPRVFASNGEELAVKASPTTLERSLARTVDHLKTGAAALSVTTFETASAQVRARVKVSNLAGHKLPSAYPSRRAWLHVRVTDTGGALLFESGALQPDGAIVGNDNDTDGSRFEPHYRTIESADQVQIYEDIMGDPDGKVTTGLLTAVQYVKDNRLLPDGFDKSSAPSDVAVRGTAADDPDFIGGGDEVEIVLPASAEASGELTISVRLLYQTVGYRWAHNLAQFDADEPQRFLRYFKDLSDKSAVVLVEAQATWKAVDVSLPAARN